MLRFKDVSYQDPALSESLHQFSKNELDGVLVKNVFDTEQIDFLLRFFQSAKQRLGLQGSVMAHPPLFTNAFQNLKAYEEYYTAYNEILLDFEHKLGKEFFAKISATITSILKLATETHEVISLKHKQSGVAAAAFTFRELCTGEGEFTAHYEGLTFDFYMDFFKLLSPDISTHHMFSFFTVLQKSEEGGELLCFDIPCSRTTQKVLQSNVINDDELGVIDFTTIASDKIIPVQPAAGDLFLFSSALTWHRVSRVTGPSSRITFGGFAAVDVQKATLYTFS